MLNRIKNNEINILPMNVTVYGLNNFLLCSMYQSWSETGVCMIPIEIVCLQISPSPHARPLEPHFADEETEAHIVNDVTHVVP